ncbi:E3 ubiquitin-protein ligase TRIM56-like [Ptychodera flava]|uniref:E3 ubiquitin-protein ligase TRIM56-like n=1 Tax=Ptychodera flava TaxID=63121 RepID=UPI00396A6419
MADNESTLMAEIDENFLRCGICFERYKNAKMLPCLHSFCEPCLIQMAEGGGAITCPVCRRQHDLTSNGVAGISTSVFLNDLVQLFTERECKAESNKCDGCDRGEATNHCVECTFDLCKACVVPHTKFPSTKSHRLVPLVEYTAAVHSNPASVQPPVYCNKHPCYDIELYCDTCDVVICAKCTISHHSKQEHQFRCVNEAAQSFKADLAAIVDKSKEKEAEAKSSKVKVQQMLESIDKCYVRQEENIRDTIRQNIEEMTRQIREHGDQLLTELKSEYDTRKVNLTAQLKELDIAENDLTSTREYAEKLMHYGNASQLLSAKKGVDYQREELLKVQTQVEPVEDDYIQFEPCNDFCREKSLGTIKFDSNGVQTRRFQSVYQNR